MAKKRTPPVCALCPSALFVSNLTQEHVIPSSIGGKRKTAAFICAACNQMTGDLWDSVLAKELHQISLFFEIKRDRRPVPSATLRTTSGELIILHHNGKIVTPVPEIIESTTPDGKTISVRAPNRETARRVISRRKDLAPGFDIDKALDEASEEVHHLSGLVEMSFSLNELGSHRSLVKTAVAHAVDSGVSSHHCADAMTFLKEETEERSFGRLYTKDIVTNRPSNSILHCVSVASVEATGQLLAYVELFSVFRFVVVLNSAYAGPPVPVQTYAIDPVSSRPLNIAVELSSLEIDIQALYEGDYLTDDTLLAAFHKALPLGMARKKEKERQAMFGFAFADAWRKCGAKEGEFFSTEHIATLSRVVAEHVVRYEMARKRLEQIPNPFPH